MLMNGDELMAILKVILHLQDYIFTNTDILDIIISLHRYGYLNRVNYHSVLEQYSKLNGTLEENAKLFNTLIEKILPSMTFGDFNRILVDAGKVELSKAIFAERHGVTQNWPPKREMTYSHAVQEYFTNLRGCAGNNSFQDGNKFQLEKILDSLNDKLKLCGGNIGRFQLLVDKRVMTYFLLAQQYSNPNERVRVMLRMRDEMPQNVDRTLFDTIFHAYMAVIWSLKDDAATAERHEQQARYTCQSCMPGLSSIILRLCIQYKNNVFYLRRHQRDYIDDIELVTVDFEEILQMLDYLTGDPKLYGTIAMLDMAHTLLGIDWDLNVCKIEGINPNNIDRARVLLSTLQTPPDTRREMMFYLCYARLHENFDLQKAEKYARKALLLSNDGCYYNVEKINIQTFLKTLSDKTLPLANI